MEWKRIRIRLSAVCNNRCRFCFLDPSGFLTPTTRQIKETLLRAKGLGFNEVLFTGGEPTIRKDIFELVSFSKEVGFQKTGIITNGRMFYYKKFCEKIIDSGLNYAYISFIHTKEEKYDRLTRAEGSFRQVMKGIHNLSEYKDRFSLGFATVILKTNIDVLEEITRFAVRLKRIFRNFVLEFSMVDPVGEAWKNREDMVPKLSELAPVLQRCKEIADQNDLVLNINHVPFCIYFDVNQLKEKTYSVTINNFRDKNHEIKYKSYKNKHKGKLCGRCGLDEFCNGVYKQYVKIYGDGELKPVNISFYKSPALDENIELIALKHDLKPVVRLFSDAGAYPVLKKFCEKNQLRMVSFVPNVIPTGNRLIYVYISKSRKKAERAMKYEVLSFEEDEKVHRKYTRKLGEILGYPHCCIQAFENKQDGIMGHKSSEEILDGIPFLLNTIPKPYRLISHELCNLECKRSLNYAHSLFKIIKRSYPKLAEKIVKQLRVPVLYLGNEYLNVAFDGCLRNGNTITYNRVLLQNPNNLYEPNVDRYLQKISILLRLKDGNRLRVDKDRILIYRDTESVGRITKSNFKEWCVLNFV